MEDMMTREIGAPAASAVDVNVNVRNHSRGGNRFTRWGSRGLMTLGAVAGLGIVYVAGENILHKFGFHGLDIPGLESTFPTFLGEVLPESTVITKQELPYCPANVGVDVGVQSSNSAFAGLGGFSVNHLFPTEHDECSVAPIDMQTTEHLIGTEVGGVTVKVSPPKPENASININDGQVLCMDLPSNASIGQVKAAAKTYNEAKKKGQTVNCNWGQSATGWFHIAHDQDPANNTFSDLQAAEDAGVLNPLTGDEQREIIKDEIPYIKKQELKQYPSAKGHIIVKAPAIQSPLQQLETNWKAQAPVIMNGALWVRFEQGSNGNIQLHLKSRYDGIEGSVGMPVKTGKDGLRDLNGLVKRTERKASLAQKR